MQNINRILTICDIESPCNELVHDAATLAREMRSALYVLTVIYNPFGVKGLSLPRPSLEEDYRKLLEKIRNELQQIISRERQLQGVVIQKIIREGRPLPTILRVIEEQKIDLLVLPAHRETWLEHFLFGGKNKALFRKMPCSILYLKSEPRALPEEEEEEGESAADEEAA